MKQYILILLLFSFIFISCHGKKNIKEKQESTKATTLIMSSAPLIIYKTTGDFYNYVPVIMNPERTRIISYPAPSDLYYQDELSKPVRLDNNYLLDRRGISRDVVFLNYTYEQYSALETAPTLQQMLSNIKEKYPLQVFIDCSSCRVERNINALNQLIGEDFPCCKKELLQIFRDEI